MAAVESRARAKVTAFTSALIVAVSSVVYLVVVPFLPAAPIVPILVGVGLGALSMRNRGVSIATLYLLVYFSILWQMIGFGFFQLLSAAVGLAVILSMAAPLVLFMSKRVELGAMALAVLSVSLMLTPAWFLSIPLIAAAAFTFSGFASLEALAGTFLFLLTPFALMENALYFTLTAGAKAPILFGQYTILAQNLRPSLPGLNVLLTGLPANYLSPHALQVSIWLSQSSEVLLIPMLILGVILVASSSAGGLTRRVIERFENSREIVGKVRIALAPLIVAAITPAVFIVLLTLLSRPDSGGFQTALTNDSTHTQVAYMLGSSILLTTSFIGREALLLRMESVQVGTDELKSLIERIIEKMKEVQEQIETLSRRVPSMSLSGERQSVSEYSSYLSDIQRQMDGASASLIEQFQSQLETTVLEPLERMPDLLRQRVASEIRGLISATASANNHLAEASVSQRYPEIAAVSDNSSIDDLVVTYEAAALEVRRVTNALSSLYMTESRALDVLMAQEEVAPPVSAAVLLESNELVSAMRLVAEEYWLNFQLRWAEPLEQKKLALVQRLGGLQETVSESDVAPVGAIRATVEAARPSNSTKTLASMKELRALLDGIVTQASSGADKVGEMLQSLELTSVRTVRFETLNRLNEILELKRRLESVSVTFDSLVNFLDSAISVLRSQNSAWKIDRENLMMLAQYPLARKIIAKMLEEQAKLPLSKLPYQKKSASLYAQLYANSTPDVDYDEASDSLVRKAEHA